jgi:hypothetical protein
MILLGATRLELTIVLTGASRFELTIVLTGASRFELAIAFIGLAILCDFAVLGADVATKAFFTAVRVLINDFF